VTHPSLNYLLLLAVTTMASVAFLRAVRMTAVYGLGCIVLSQLVKTVAG
jgi:hypothetical protein